MREFKFRVWHPELKRIIPINGKLEFCYEYGYLKIDNENYMLVKRATD